MALMLAIKSFIKALKKPAEAKKFLDENLLHDSSKAQEPELGHLRLLALLQKEARLVDFIKEDISCFSDAQVGAAVRKIHADCGKNLEEFITMRPLMNETEGAHVTVPHGYDPNAIKVIGKIAGQPPYQGILRHKGWKAHKLSLPRQVGKSDHSVIYPAEIEVK
jgi:hypothetical protein